MLVPALAYALFALWAAVGPGLAVLRLLKLKIDPAVVLPLGLVLSAGLYWVGAVGHAPWLFPAGVSLLDASLVVGWLRSPWSWAEGPSLRGALAPLAGVVLLLSLTRYPLNRPDPSGDFVLDPVGLDDTAFHVGLTWELTHSYPPQVPGLSGFIAGYHLGPHLVRAAALRWLGIAPFDALTRFEPTLAAAALILALRGAARAIGAGPAAVAIVPWSLLATDFSFLLAGHPGVPFWTDVLRGNLLLAVVLGNSVVPALALALVALVALGRHLAGEGRGWLVVAAALGLGVAFFKVFVAAQLLLGLGVAWLFARRRALLAILVPAALATAALALGQGSETIDVLVDPFVPVRGLSQALGLAPPHGLALAPWTAFWLVASLGLRLLGLAPAVKALRSATAPASALAAMALSGWPLGLLLRISPHDLLPGQKVFNEATYFIEQSGAILWVFAVIGFVGFMERRGRVWPAVLAAALVLPSTLQFVARKIDRPTHRIPAGVMKAMHALKADGKPGDIVLQRPDPRYPPPPVLFLGRRVPYTRVTHYMTQFAPAAALAERLDTVRSFFRTTDPHEALLIAQRLGATHLCLYDDDEVRFDPRQVMRPIYESGDARVYRLLR